MECKSFLGIMSRRTRGADCATRPPFAQLATVPSALPRFQRRALRLLRTGWPRDCSPRCPGRRGSQRFRTASALGRWGLAGSSANPTKWPMEAITTFHGRPGREHDGSISRGGEIWSPRRGVAQLPTEFAPHNDGGAIMPQACAPSPTPPATWNRGPQLVCCTQAFFSFTL